MIIDHEFRDLLPSLTTEELAGLEQSLINEGCQDSLKVWAEEDILIDGHNRYTICRKHGIDFIEEQISLPDRLAAMEWVEKRQVSQRNLSWDQKHLIMGRAYERTKRQGERTDLTLDQSDPKLHTSEVLAKQYDVAPATIKRAAADYRLIADKPELQREILSKEKKFKDVKNDIRRKIQLDKVESIESMEAKELEGVYDVIVIDPPWPMQKIERDVAPNQVGFDYPTMTESELENLTIPTAEDCHIWLWTTHKFLPMAFRLLNTWDFKYVCLFTWHKPGGFQPFGLPQYNCEFALYARKGTPIFIDTKAFPVCFNAPRGAHSEKPKEFYEMINRVTSGRKLDMFSRRNIEGFDAWGKEAV